MNPNLEPATTPTGSHSRLAGYIVFPCTVFANMAAVATVASSELPLILGGL